ncbi:hypothetical protein HER10_EVM0003495 [Colletotrichum scovillei]|uniref:uncharacterized protein n=1 Tax=Colletotrichum scovillei TaxID=1209932 RepID=UPI0015C32E9D|nr:uncharacterized protein HER10_EVM0003495 [Colletotrichum scovillei]KAF4781808.1 hypothetical protein HER10_EVM0003495 [Colletotrichum scovillei]
MAPTYELWQSVIAKIASEEWIDMRGKEHGNDMDSLTIGGQNGGRKITVLVSPDLIESSFEELQLQNRKQLDNNLARSPVEPILVLLDIIHGGHMFIPEEKSEEELFASKRGSVQELGQLVGWAQKYELEHLLVPYLKEWMPNEAEIDAIDIDVVVIAANLAFGLGDGGMYDKLINRLGFECSVNRNGDISYPNSIKKTKFARTMMPFGIDGEATKCPPFPASQLLFMI